jgi:hypothetical protein
MKKGNAEMKLSWLWQQFYLRCFGEMRPTKIRMGLLAYKEYHESALLYYRHPIEVNIVLKRFNGADVVIDSLMPPRAIEFVVGPQEIIPIDEPAPTRGGNYR